MAKEEKGYWFSTENGTHIHAEEGETPKEATEKRFGKFGKKENKEVEKKTPKKEKSKIVGKVYGIETKDMLNNIGVPDLADKLANNEDFTDADLERIKKQDEEFLKQYDNWENNPTRKELQKFLKEKGEENIALGKEEQPKQSNLSSRPKQDAMYDYLDQFADDKTYKDFAGSIIKWNGTSDIADTIRKNELIGEYGGEVDYDNMSDEELVNALYDAMEDGLVSGKQVFDTIVGGMNDDEVGKFAEFYDMGVENEEDDYMEKLGVQSRTTENEMQSSNPSVLADKVGKEQPKNQALAKERERIVKSYSNEMKNQLKGRILSDIKGYFSGANTEQQMWGNDFDDTIEYAKEFAKQTNDKEYLKQLNELLKKGK